jgi:ornithine cyclodeaminase
MRPLVSVIQESAISEAMPLDREVVSVIEDAFARHASGEILNSPMMQILVPEFEGQTCVKGAFIPGCECLAVKISSTYPRQSGASVAEANGILVVIDASTGRVRACLLDNGYLTQVRTAAAGAVAAKYLAPAQVHTVGVIGSGKQALWQVKAAYLVRPFKRVLIWSRRDVQAAELAGAVEAALPVSAHIAAKAERVTAQAQLVITATSSRQPLLTECNLHPSLHITAVGADSKGKRELSDGLLREVDLYVPDDLAQCRLYGEMQSTLESNIARIVPLGNIVAKPESGRKNQGDVTVADLTGLGVQDTAIATETYLRLKSAPK